MTSATLAIENFCSVALEAAISISCCMMTFGGQLNYSVFASDFQSPCHSSERMNAPLASIRLGILTVAGRLIWPS